MNLPRSLAVRSGLSRAAPTLLLAVAAAALLTYLRFLYTHALNVPYHDDILDVLDFLVRFGDAPAWGDRLRILFEQYNDHRTAASRLVYWLIYRACGQLDFRTLCLVANLSVALLIGLYAAVAPPGRRALVAALAALVLCQPHARDFLLWPMSVFAFQGVIVYGFACLLALRVLRPHRFALALLCAAGAMYSLSSGQVVWPVGAALLVHARLRGEPRAALYLGLWLVAGAGAIALFHHGFNNPNPVLRLLGYAVADPATHIGYFLAMVGSPLAFGNLPAALLAGSCCLPILLLLSRSGLRRGLRTPVFFAWYLLLCMAIVTLGRAPYSLLDYALEPRYSVASLNLLVTMLLLALSSPEAPARAGILALLLAAGFCTLSYRHYTPAVDAVVRERAAAYDTGNYWVFGYPMEHTNRLVDNAVRRGIYVPPARPLQVWSADD